MTLLLTTHEPSSGALETFGQATEAAPPTGTSLRGPKAFGFRASGVQGF